MSKSKPPKKVVVTTTSPTTTSRTTTATGSSRPAPTVSTRSRQTTPAPKAELLFGKQNFIWMAIGVGLIALGLMLMAGGHMPSPDVWEPNRIYSFTRITLAPILILAGLAVEIYAIFKKNNPPATSSSDTE
ncbi:MAG: DUF3098 domain-containing protein [Saprospiraceae bacterium]